MSKARDLANAGTALTSVSATELGYVDGVTSAIQTQLDSKIGASSAINPTIVDAKGDIIAATAADTVARLAVGSNNQVLTADSSTATGLKWATPGSTFAGCSLYKSANQSLTSSAGANATFDTELFDTDGFHSTSSNTDRIVIPSGKAGYYLLTGRANFAASATGIRIGMIRKNAGATQLARHTMNNVSAVADAVLTVNTVVNLSVSDYVVFECYQDGTGALNLQGGGEQYTTFSAIYLGA